VFTISKEKHTILEVTSGSISITLHLDIEKSPAGGQSTSQWIPLRHIIMQAFSSCFHKLARFVLESAATGKPTAFAKNAKKLLVSQTRCLCIACSNFTREHVRELGIELDELTSYVNTLLVKGFENGICRSRSFGGSKTVEAVDELP
jgi:hypothetical protein